MAEKYLSIKKSVTGFSFANLGIFYGLGSGIISAIYSLVMLDIFQNSATVGIYFAIYYAFCMIVGLFAGEFFRLASKARLFYISMLSLALLYFMMAFSIKPATFIAFDFISGIPMILVSLLIPLFMTDFAKGVGISKLNGRYHFWLNAGALAAPMIAMAIAGAFGVRAPFFAAAAVFLAGFLVFNLFGIIQEDKVPTKISPRRTLRSVWRNTILYFRRPALARAYVTTFASYAMSAMRGIYVPIIVIENGFSKDTLGLVLTLGIIPYVILSEPMAYLARRWGKRFWLSLGFLSFAGLAFWASFASGWTILAIFVLWQISGAFIEPLRDLLFFDAAKRQEQSRFFGIYKTSNNIPRFIAPILGAGAILVFGMTSAVWLITGTVALIAAAISLKK